MDPLFSSLFFQRVRATRMTQHRVENTRVHFWTFSPVSEIYGHLKLNLNFKCYSIILIFTLTLNQYLIYLFRQLDFRIFDKLGFSYQCQVLCTTSLIMSRVLSKFLALRITDFRTKIQFLK